MTISGPPDDAIDGAVRQRLSAVEKHLTQRLDDLETAFRNYRPLANPVDREALYLTLIEDIAEKQARIAGLIADLETANRATDRHSQRVAELERERTEIWPALGERVKADRLATLAEVAGIARARAATISDDQGAGALLRLAELLEQMS